MVGSRNDLIGKPARPVLQIRVGFSLLHPPSSECEVPNVLLDYFNTRNIVIKFFLSLGHFWLSTTLYR